MISEQKRKLYYKLIGELTTEEFNTLFGIGVDVNDDKFKKSLKPFSNYTVANINPSEIDVNEMDFIQAYLLGHISGMQTEIPINRLIVLFGESGSGKSHIIKFIHAVKKIDLDNLNMEKLKELGLDIQMYKPPMSIKELKEFCDSINIIRKDTNRPMRGNNPNNPEIREGVSIEEVKKGEYIYENGEYVYSFLKANIENALESGHAIMIINNDKTILDVCNHYKNRVLPVFVHVDKTKDEWVDLMQEDNRSPEEIKSRYSNYGYAGRIYDEIFEEIIPDVVLNISNYDGKGSKISNHALIHQLMGCVHRAENSRGIGQSELERD